VPRGGQQKEGAWPDSGGGRPAPALERRVRAARCAWRGHAAWPVRWHEEREGG
jgi:hypothetical protein